MDVSVPAKPANRWNQPDLARRVIHALDVARQAIQTLVEADSARGERGAPANAASMFPSEKLVSETAMLLLVVDPIRSLDKRIQDHVELVADLLIPRARHEDVRAAICLDPGLARDHAFAHVLLSRLGYPDPDVDQLLSKSLAMGVDFGPERLPHRRLEQAWLARLWKAGEPPSRLDSRLVADSMLGRPIDTLGSTRFDFYAFTHAVMYATDLGERRIALNRSKAAIAADAEAALAYSLDANELDLAAEVLLTWPMLRIAWSSAATFAFGILANVEDNLGFLPGSAFDLARYQTLTGDDRSRYALMTSYHSAYVMGFLCAVALRPGCAPPAAVPPSRRFRDAGKALLRLVNTDRPSCWIEPFGALGPRQQDSVAPLVLAAVLRRAKTEGNLRMIREALEIALAYDLIDAPTPIQAAALLRRSQTLQL